MWGGQISFDSPMLFSLGLCMFVLGGLSGVPLASPPGLPPPRQLLRRSPPPLRAVRRLGLSRYAGIYFGSRSSSGDASTRDGAAALRAHVHRVQHDLLRAASTRPRGHAPPGRRLPAVGRVTFLNQISTIGSFLLGVRRCRSLWNVWRTLHGEPQATTRGTATRSRSLSSARGELREEAPHPVGAAGVGRQPPGRPVDQRLVVRGERDPILMAGVA